MGSLPFVLANIDDLSPIYNTLKSTQRIKYTCFTVSPNFIILGATSGGLYIFRRQPCVFLQLLPNKEGSISCVRISPDENLIAFSSVKGTVSVLERLSKPGSRCLQMSTEHVGTEVTALQWGGPNELYIGDNTGRVSVLAILQFMAKSMFNTPSFQLMQLDSQVVQMDWQAGLLLVSTLSRSYLCDTAKEQYRQIGQQLREGAFGACFGAADTDIRMFCARPGSRLWEVDPEGLVMSTHQFKQSLAVPPTPAVSLSSQNTETYGTNNKSEEVLWPQQSINFAKILSLSEKYLFTFKADGLYIFDPETASVILWNNEFTDIIDAATVNDSIYIWTGVGKMHALSLYPLDKFLITLYFCKQFNLCAEMCDLHKKSLIEAACTSTNLHLLADLGSKINDNDLVEKLEPFISLLAKYSREKKTIERLDSGICVVGNQFYFRNEVLDRPTSKIPHSRRTDHLKEKSRSLSLSPERRKPRTEFSKGLDPQKKSESHSSLPDFTSMSNNSENFGDQTLSNGDHSTSVNLDDTFNKNDGSFLGVTSPETIQVLKDIGQTFTYKITNGTKSLKKKWQFIEDKMKQLGQENPPELLDVKDKSYESFSSLGSPVSDDVVFETKKSPVVPQLDVSQMIFLCQKYNEVYPPNTDIAISLLNSIIINYYKLKICKNSKNSELLLQSETETNHAVESELSKTILESFITSEIDGFPFSSYLKFDEMEILKNVFRGSFEKRYLVTWLQSVTACIDVIPSSLKHFGEIHKSADLIIDIFLSRFLIVCSELINPSLILGHVKNLKVPCYYVSFSALLDRYHEGVWSLVVSEGRRSNENSEWPLPRLLNAMFIMLQMDQIDTCCVMGKTVAMIDVCYLVLRLQEYLESQGSDKSSALQHCQHVFLSYLTKVPDMSVCLCEIFTDNFLSYYTVTAFESLNADVGTVCNCGFPVSISSEIEVKFEEVGDAISSYFQQTNHKRLVTFCEKVPSVWFSIIARTKKDDIESHLALIVHLQSIDVFEKYLCDVSYECWEKILRLIFKHRCGICLNCEAKICIQDTQKLSLSAIGLLLIKNLGPVPTLKLLSKYVDSLGPGELDQSFYKSCMYAALVDTHKGGLRNKVVDMVQGTYGNSFPAAVFSSEVADEVQSSLLQDGSSVSISGSDSHHWGLSVNLDHSLCSRCFLPLGSEVLINDGGLVAFSCAHIFHSVCLHGIAGFCPLCGQEASHSASSK